MLPFVRQLKGSQNLYVSAVPFSDNTVSGEFAMAGVDNALKQVLEACGAKF
ncbi:hypothetical protein [Chenggangzhangella methanolivorans]|uniref:Uncharacterized protein n=1 Tax=Chenggangzhangella methanolivorans TaxID=1437009 RepID=A0A9E6RD38_9HYPH|nr:hypothetical protein [Chenggangzhangella methanolivorans]QZN98551.1 hypothetical protein K6K41_16065 [Chenggangzhangella methanolivorans]